MDTITGKYEIWDKLIESYAYLKKVAENIAKSNENYFIESIFIALTLDYYEKLYVAEAKKIPIAMLNAGIPVEFFYAVDLFPLVQEMVTIPLSSAGTQNHLNYIDHAEKSGLSSELCNNIKIWIGAMLQGATPKPDMIIHADFPCDSTTIEWQIIRDYYKVPGFTFDVPYWHYDKNHEFFDDKTIPYYVSQLKGMMDFIEKKAHVRYTLEKLKETFERSNQARTYILEILELIRAKPNPLNSDTCSTLYSTLLISSGLAAPNEYIKMVRDKAIHNYQNKISAISERFGGKEEKYRCFWTCMPVYFDPLVFSWMEEKLQISTVMNMMGNQVAQPVDTSSEEVMLSDIAKNILDVPMGRQLRGPVEYLIDDIIRTIKEYQVDFCIWGGHISCKQSWGTANLVKQLIHERTGVPTLIFEVDDLDNRIIGTRAIKKMIRNFVKDILDS
ncbi:MAG: 2-hydroxyacyl-CoA dehydratase [Candidatus Helarchaeota archaeon]|nr:2-hydroxyacyl-CoA dehydratase [Candidatus Helarchaeota archaeon]